MSYVSSVSVGVVRGGLGVVPSRSVAGGSGQSFHCDSFARGVGFVVRRAAVPAQELWSGALVYTGGGGCADVLV